MGVRYLVARTSDVPPGTMKGVNAGLTPVLLANVEGTIYAISGLCPHLFVPLSVSGKLDGCYVTCTVHGSKFDLRTGEAVEWVTSKLPFGAEQLFKLKGKSNAESYEVFIEGDQVIVEV